MNWLRVSALAAFGLLQVSCSSPESIRSKTHQKPYLGVVFTEYGSSGYSRKTTNSYLQFSEDIRANTASVLMTCMTESKTSSRIDCDSYDSPKEKDIASILQKARARGFKTSLRVYVDLKTGDWRALWDPNDKVEAFKQLESILVRFARLSSKENVDVFILGAELEKLTQPKYRDAWIHLIAKVRSVYKGKITYGANGNFSSYKTPEYQWVPFWDRLDFLGIDHYAPLEKGLLPTAKNLHQHHCSAIDRYQSVAPSMPMYFVEVGFPSAEYGYQKPFEWRWRKDSKINYDLQGRNIRAFLKCFWTKKTKGVSVWRFMSESKKLHHGGYFLDHSETKFSLKAGFLSL